MIKLSILDTKYQTDNKTYVKCIIKCKLTNELDISKFQGVARLHEGDQFYYGVGCKIALAKAERAAYKCYTKHLKRKINFLSEILSDFQCFVDKAEKIIEHNSKYIHNIANDIQYKCDDE